jgi:hypothetical protein
VVHREDDGAAGKGQDKQAQQVARPDGTNEGKLAGQAHTPNFAREGRRDYAVFELKFRE